MEKQNRFSLDGFSWNLILEKIFPKTVEKIQVLLKSDKNYRYLTWRPVYIYNNHHHHHLALQPYLSLGLLCYSPPLVSIVSFPSPFFNPHLSQVLLNVHLQHLCELFLQWKIFHAKVVEIIKTRILYSKTLSPKIMTLWDNVKKKMVQPYRPQLTNRVT